MSEGEVSLIGTLERVVFSNPENGFLIGTFLEENTVSPITIKGIVFEVQDQQKLHLKGNWENHPQYGKQFAVREYMTVEPNTREGIERYLASGVFPGIGPKTAERIYQKFGEKTFEILDQDPEQLLKIKRFTRKQLQAVKEGREDQQGFREVMTFLHGLGISQAFAARIYAAFGMNSIPLVKSNPYQLTEVNGIGFVSADVYARRLGFGENSPERASCALTYMLEQQAQNGHTCFPRQELIEKTVEELHIKQEVVEDALEVLTEERLVKVLEPTKNSAFDTEMLARPRFYFAEQRIVENFQRLIDSEAFTKFDAERDLIASQENRLGIELDAVQLEAIHAALQNKVLIITGGPGTGKTTLVRFILGLMSRRIPSVALAAPTGRAAKRLTETTSYQASTIHRLLEADNMGFQRNRDQPLESELLIIDESSMIDTLLMDALLDAISSSARLVLVGDVDQLPSVGPGMVLRDLIESELVAVVRLERIFRQAEDSLITSNAHHVRLGHLPELPRGETTEKLKDFYFIRESDPEQIVEKVTRMVSKNIPERFGFDPFQDIQVLTPMHRGVTGSINLNRSLQSVLNPDGTGFEHREQWFKTGDKLMQQQNDYDKQVFNGDTGRIVFCDPKSREIHVSFDQGTVRYTAKEIDQLALAYAISVHKSQGSEYPALILPLTTHHYMMLQRNLLYTALTRGKQLVILIGMEKAVAMAVKNEEARTRHTSLPRHFREMKELMAL